MQLHSENFSVPLTVVPFRNGNTEKDGIGKFYDETYKIEGLFFNGEQKVSKAGLRGIDIELFLLQLPASRVYLLDEHYHIANALPNIEDRHKIDRAFVLFSAIKRAISIAKRRENCWQ